MTTARLCGLGALVVGIGAGTIVDRPAQHPPLFLGGYRVIAADFHTHSSTWSDGGLTPWGLVLEARRQGLDAISINGHSQVSDSRVGAWFARTFGGLTVLTGEEIVAPGHHVIAIGVTSVVDRHLSVADQVDEIHRQSGAAIAAHPDRHFWPGFDTSAIEKLDGAEVCHPIIFGNAKAQKELEDFATRGSLAAIGSSDFHAFGRMGVCRTYVFARDVSPDAIVEAVRAHRTVVYTAGDKVFGDPALIPLAARVPRLKEEATTDATPATLDWISRVFGVTGLLLLVRPSRTALPSADTLPPRPAR